MTDKEKQIEELAKDIFQNCTCEIWFSEAEKIANFIINNQCYRKASDVATEVINKAMSKILIIINSIEQTNIITEFNGGAKTALEIVFKDLAELRKEYTEDVKSVYKHYTDTGATYITSEPKESEDTE